LLIGLPLEPVNLPPGETYNKFGEGIPMINGPVEFSEGPFGKTVVNQYTTAPTNLCEEGDLLLCVRGSTTGRTNIAGFKACIGRGVAAIRPFFGLRALACRGNR
jgi:type I restriction enzyme S subunit